MIAVLAACLFIGIVEDDRPCVIVVVGTPGEADFKGQFEHWAGSWKNAAGKARADCILIGAGGQTGSTDHDRLHSVLVEKSKAGREPLWIVLIGHGTYDGHEAKFNLQGPDLTDAELGGWLTLGEETGCCHQLCFGQRSFY